MSKQFQIVAYLPARHPSRCAVHDPTPGPCDCGAKDEPLIRLSDALAAPPTVEKLAVTLHDDTRERADQDD